MFERRYGGLWTQTGLGILTVAMIATVGACTRPDPQPVILLETPLGRFRLSEARLDGWVVIGTSGVPHNGFQLVFELADGGPLPNEIPTSVSVPIGLLPQDSRTPFIRAFEPLCKSSVGVIIGERKPIPCRRVTASRERPGVALDADFEMLDQPSTVQVLLGDSQPVTVPVRRRVPPTVPAPAAPAKRPS